ncbi:SDR family NAD(P)-dependent oxidoreductase [Asticcacaulis sp. 201]|uniref:SDR family NAD(P)-dependent oxidoreductase n=1 Tax=Asticcacaulis sp. 201 TaxID=3028787 RepID=UPI002916B1DF|nr:SDR family NAD(P)-dependent oxidoreductase [Asticcacaulis sp. 201]MDV6331186.1 SDR family NAD(P)-dependent oxidoreductase [Asticcacaulis sp. 201]
MNTQAFLNGRTALITGSVQGIGLAIATAMATAGARVALHGLAAPEQVEAAIEIMRQAGAPDVRFFPGDLRDAGAITGLMTAVSQWTGGQGGPDILINNAGIQKTVSFSEITDDIWTDLITVNLTGAFRTMRLALPQMARRGYGRVINIASVHGLVASTDKGPYVAAKHGLIGLSKVAALEYARAGTRDSGGVTVNCICPGWTETALIEPQILSRAASLGGDRVAGIASLLADKQPTQRLSAPSEIGLLSLWLTSPLAHNITGTAIPIDGGWTAQ